MVMIIVNIFVLILFIQLESVIYKLFDIYVFQFFKQ